MENELNETFVAIQIVKKQQQQRCIGATIHRRVNGLNISKKQSQSYEHIDSSTQQISYRLEFIEFIDNEHFSSLDSLFIQIGACKLYLPEEFQNIEKGEGKKLHNIFQHKNIEVHYLKKLFFTKKNDTTSKMEILLCDKLSPILSTIEKDYPIAFGTVECLFSAVKVLDIYVNVSGKYEVVLGSVSSYVRLDSAAAEAINLLPKSDHPSSFGSIYGVLNRCKTKMGSRLLERWLRQPLIDHDEINRRLDTVEVLKSSISLRNQLTNEILKSIPDLDTVVVRMQKKNANLAEVYRLYIFSKALPKMIENLKNLVNEVSSDDDRNKIETITQKFLIPFQSLSVKFSLYEQLVEHVLDLNQLPDLIVNPKHDPELAELAEELDGIESKSQSLLKQARDDWCSGMDVKLEESTQHGLIFRSTKADDERQIRANNSNAKILSILKNGVHFTTPALERLADHRLEINTIYKEKQSLIATKAIETALSYLPVAESASTLVAELDVLNSFANVASMSANHYTRPKIMPLGSGLMNMKAARHPCVELMEEMTFIANDYQLVRNESNFQIITGPNMGGKSTYIRGIGSIVVMAQVGSYIPCNDGAIVTIVDSILARVGAGDAVQKGVSTFMAEMLEASVILQTATPNSLLIVDELGRGTSTFDGFGIAWAMSEYIVQRINCFALFATHFHELTALEKNHTSVVNKHVSAMMENNQLVMMYTLQSGPCSQSFGVHVASSAGFPRMVITEAKRKAAILEKVGYEEHGDDFENDLSISEEHEEKRRKLSETMSIFSNMPLPDLPTHEIRTQLGPLFPPFSVETSS